jgi:hypothetical protein
MKKQPDKKVVAPSPKPVEKKPVKVQVLPQKTKSHLQYQGKIV